MALAAHLAAAPELFLGLGAAIVQAKKRRPPLPGAWPCRMSCWTKYLEKAEPGDGQCNPVHNKGKSGLHTPSRSPPPSPSSGPAQAKLNTHRGCSSLEPRNTTAMAQPHGMSVPDGLEPVRHDMLPEFVQPYDEKQVSPHQKASPAAVGAPTGEKTIFGLRKPTFFLLLLLILVIIIAAVAGGVGGSVAVSNAYE